MLQRRARRLKYGRKQRYYYPHTSVPLSVIRCCSNCETKSHIVRFNAYNTDIATVVE
jgi:hypothetical protein